MGNFTIFWMFENPRRGRQARNFTTNVPKILDLKSPSEQIFSRKLSLGAPATTSKLNLIISLNASHILYTLHFLRRCQVQVLDTF